MSAEINKATVRRFTEEVFNQGHLALMDELFAPNILHHQPGMPDICTLEDLKRSVTESRSAFPDFHVTIEDMIAEGEQVVTRWTMSGTNTGDFVMPEMRTPATGKQVTVTGMGISRFAGGKYVENWFYPDMLGMLQQLGLIPMPQ